MINKFDRSIYMLEFIAKEEGFEHFIERIEEVLAGIDLPPSDKVACALLALLRDDKLKEVMEEYL